MGIIFRLFAVLRDWSGSIEHARSRIILASLAGGLSGLASTALIAVINSALNKEMSWSLLVWEFALLCAVIPLSGFTAQILMVRLTAQAAYDLRIRLSRQILAAPYRLLEELGSHRLMATLNDDIPAVTTAITTLPLLLMQLAIMTGCLIYLGWLSWPLLLLMLGYMVLGIATYQLPLIRSVRYFRLMRIEWDSMFRSIRSLTEGIKELKLNRDRRDAFRSQQLEPAVSGIREYGLKANTLTIAATSWGQILFFIFIGLSIFLSPLFIAADHQTMTGYTLTLLFMVSPLGVILSNMPTLGKAWVAAEAIRRLRLSLTDHQPEAAARPVSPSQPWSRLEVSGLTHIYRQEGIEEFHLGPIDLTFYPGELVFLIGGNGSGKTTLAKLLIGLYEPEAGEIRLDGQAVSDENRDEYRQHFAVVFYDFHIFDRLFGVNGDHLEARGNEYLARLQLDQKVRIEGDKLSRTDLSQGQRKRLALLAAYLEDRPIYVFDEWASDQDPMFKEIFYYQILPELKAKGKTVIVITHDDHYYGVADRLVKLEQGQVEYDKRLKVQAGDAMVAGADR
ncbi:MAG TPA: cyclic peptide export ABC transporter [Thermoanaerobaculia bacterium]|jgi:putative ATP-binding cassette transporter|nr:cyclic peptide export ABC transporter [Thermoanaerobaculia bacterium]